LESYKHFYSERKHKDTMIPYQLQTLCRSEREPESLQYFLNTLNSENTRDDEKAAYIHVPFCDSICTFCYFPKTLKKGGEVENYLRALKLEIEMYAKTRYISTSKFGALYFGGGTPTSLSSEQLTDLLLCCKESFNFSENAEITVEGSTFNSDEKKLKKILEKGANRLSFGVQTFNDSTRKLLNLQDDASHVIHVIKTACELGCDNVDIDLMCNLPGQTIKDWKKDLQTAIDLEVKSVCIYELTVHPNTKLAKQLQTGEIPPIGSVDFEIDMYLEAVDTLTEADYKQQHITYFTLPKSDHKYVRISIKDDCVGMGSGSAGNIEKYTYSNNRSLDKYIEIINNGKFPIGSGLILSKKTEMEKFMVRGMSLLSINKGEFSRRFGKVPEDVFTDTIAKLKRKGLITVDKQEIKLTRMGRVWGFNVCAEFLPKEYKEILKKISLMQTKKEEETIAQKHIGK